MAIAEDHELRVQSISQGKLTWVYIEKPTEAEAQFLASTYGFHPLEIDDVMSRAQRPKLDEATDHLFMVMQFPVFDKANRITRPSEVDIFVGENYVVTVHCSGDLKPLSKFFQECRTREESRAAYLGRSSGYLLYHIIDRLVNYCFPILNRITESIEELEDLVFTEPVPQTVRSISFLRRDLISFRRVVRPLIAVIETLEQEDYPFFREEQEVYFGDIADHVRKIWDGLEDCREVVDGLYETSNWFTTHRIQEIMRVLTIITVILAPLTLLSGIYGMNIPLPGGVEGGSLASFLGILALMGATGIAMLAFLRHRHWI
ncbi:MAG: magnesium transporter CorA family protein [Dehalococcoidia bacterium]|nr:magnesium transporter CorA family protein [Dehalococcoidia bacterium]